MTAGGSSAPRPKRNERRQATREKASALREEQRKKDRRNRWFIQGGIAVVVVVVVALVGWLLVDSAQNAGPGPGPENMASDGIVIGEGLVAQRTPALAPDATPTPTETDPTGKVVDIRVYLDYMCPVCGQFEATNGAQLTTMVQSGAATVEFHPISILDRLSMGTKYSSRAANAAGCVANYSPDSFWAFNTLMFQNQPGEGTAGLSNDELKAITASAGVDQADAINACIDDGQFKSWVDASTQRALSGPIPGSTIESVISTPTILVNGQKYSGSLEDPKEFAAFVLAAAGDAFSTATPTPAPAG